jgi:hypothetical protein
MQPRPLEFTAVAQIPLPGLRGPVQARPILTYPIDEGRLRCPAFNPVLKLRGAAARP